LPEGKTLDHLLSRTLHLFQTQILKYIESSDTKNIDNNNNNTNENKYEETKERKELKDNNDLPQGVQGVILALIWISKSLFMRPTAWNFGKTFSWQENFSSFLCAILTQPVFTVLKNSELVKYVNLSHKLPDVLAAENGKIGEFFGEKMNIIMTNVSHILPEKNANFPSFYNNFSPFWKQRTWTRLAIPLLKKMVEINKINISENKTTANSNNIQSNNIDNNNINNTNNIANKNNNTDRSTDSTYATPCLLGLLNLTKNIPGNILSSHSEDLSRIIISALKINFEEYSARKIESGSVTDGSKDTYALSGENHLIEIIT
jgi:hypothetical protein